MEPYWKTALCEVCGEGFLDQDDWDNRHSGYDGEEIHEGCCDCPPDIDWED